MGVGTIFFQGGRKNGEISFYPLETKKTTFLLKFNRQMSNFKIQGNRAPPAQPLPTLKTTLSIAHHRQRWDASLIAEVVATCYLHFNS